MIPFLDLAKEHDDLAREVESAIDMVVRSGRYILGSQCSSFGAEFAEYCGTAHCVGTGNGLDALELLLRAWGIGPGDEVIVPSHTYIATWLAVSRAGASVRPVEPTVDSFFLDPAGVEAAISPRTRAVVAAHLYGDLADMPALSSLAVDRPLILLEDAAQAHGATRREGKAGSLGHGAAFSFYPTKNLGAIGDGGAVTTNDPEIASRVRLLRNYGSSEKYVHEIRGVNSRLDEIQASVLRVKLRHLEEWNECRRALAARYTRALEGLPDLVVPRAQSGTEPVWHVYVVRHQRRDALQEYLEQRRIGTQIYYPIPPHLSQAYQDAGWHRGSFPLAERIASENLALPLSPGLSIAHQDTVIEAVREFCGSGT